RTATPPPSSLSLHDALPILIEAGPDYGERREDWPAEILNPAYLWEESHPWGYYNAPGPTGYQVHLPRGKVLGGSSTINACVWLRSEEHTSELQSRENLVCRL